MRQALTKLVDEISEDLSHRKFNPSLGHRMSYWRGYVACLFKLNLRYGRIVDEAMSSAEFTAFVNAIDNYDNTRLSVDIE